MSPDPMPDFHHALMLRRGSLDAAELAECHGALCGLICRGGAASNADYLAQLAALQLLVNPSEALSDLFADARISTIQQLADMDMGFNLWLPDDDQPLLERTASLAHWCTGLLAGLGLGGALPELSAEATEALDDLRQIAQAAYSQLPLSNAELEAELGQQQEELNPESRDPEDEEEPEAEEDDEVAFTEIVEYVRVVTLMLCEEMRGPGADDLIH